MKTKRLVVVLLLAMLAPGAGFAQIKIKASYGAPSLSVIQRLEKAGFFKN